MKTRITIVGSFILLASCSVLPAHADDAPTLPGHYSQVILDVEGMI